MHQAPARERRQKAGRRGRRGRWLPPIAAALLFVAGLVAAADPSLGGVTVRGGLRGTVAPGQFAGQIGECGTCHVAEAGLSHPVGIIPSMSVPPHLPLDYGAISCLTCHRNPTGPEHDTETAAGSSMLRVDAARLCAECHDPASLRRADMHATMLGRAHLPLGGSGPRSDDRTGSRPAEADSDRCLTCHDGTIAPDVGHQRRIPPSQRFGSGRSIGRGGGPKTASNSHPIGIEYPVSQSFRDGAPLHPRSNLDRRIRLFDNRVECGSCHSPYSTEPGLLAMSNLASSLCMSCHDE